MSDPWWKRELLGPLRLWHMIFIVVVIGALVKGCIWLVTPRTVNSKITDIRWEYTTNIRQRGTYHGSGWGRPGGVGFYREPAFNTSCQRRYYGTEDCGCRYRTTLGWDGEMKRRWECDRCSVYKDWCEYDYYDWPVIETASFEGHDHLAKYPELTPKGPLQRLQREDDYWVTFNGKEETIVHQPSNLIDFKDFFVGDYWILKIARVTGTIDSMKKMTAEAE